MYLIDVDRSNIITTIRALIASDKRVKHCSVLLPKPREVTFVNFFSPSCLLLPPPASRCCLSSPPLSFGSCGRPVMCTQDRWGTARWPPLLRQQIREQGGQSERSPPRYHPPPQHTHTYAHLRPRSLSLWVVESAEGVSEEGSRNLEMKEQREGSSGRHHGGDSDQYLPVPWCIFLDI